MRMTITLDDQLAERVRCAATEQGVSVSAFIARTLDDALQSRVPEAEPPFRLVTVQGGQRRRGVDFDRPRSLDVAEDEIQFGSLSS